MSEWSTVQGYGEVTVTVDAYVKPQYDLYLGDAPVLAECSVLRPFSGAAVAGMYLHLVPRHGDGAGLSVNGTEQ